MKKLDEFNNHNIRIGQNICTGHNICIGHNAGYDITTECYQLRIKSKTITVNETMTSREYDLISKTVKAMLEIK